MLSQRLTKTLIRPKIIKVNILLKLIETLGVQLGITNAFACSLKI